MTAKNENYAWDSDSLPSQPLTGFKLLLRPPNPRPVDICGIDSQQFLSSGGKIVAIEFTFDLGVASARIKARTEALYALTWLYDGFSSRMWSIWI